MFIGARQEEPEDRRDIWLLSAFSCYKPTEDGVYLIQGAKHVIQENGMKHRLAIVTWPIRLWNSYLATAADPELPFSDTHVWHRCNQMQSLCALLAQRKLNKTLGSHQALPKASSCVLVDLLLQRAPPPSRFGTQGKVTQRTWIALSLN